MWGCCLLCFAGTARMLTIMASPKGSTVRSTEFLIENCTVNRSVMFGDNQSVVTSSTIPHSPLTKWWTALSYHRVREAIASKLYTFFHIPGEENPADIISKQWSHNKIWHVLQPLLFCIKFILVYLY